MQKFGLTILLITFLFVNISVGITMPLSHEMLETLWHKADSDYVAGDWHTAQLNYERALEAAKRSQADKATILKLSIKLASTYAYQNQFLAAEPIYQQLLTESIQPNNKESGWSDEAVAMFDDLADAYVYGSDKVNKENGLKHALTIKEKLAPQGSDEVLKILNRLFIVYFVHKRYSDAEPVLKKMSVIIERTNGHDLPNVLTSLAGVEAFLGRYRESLNVYTRVYPIWVRTVGPYQEMSTSVAREIGLMYMKLGDLQQAQSWAEKAISLRQLGHRENTLEYARDWYVLGRIYDSKGSLANAEKCYKEAMNKAEQLNGKDSVELVVPMKSLISILKKANKSIEAKNYESLVARLEAKGGSAEGSIARDAL